MFCMMSRIRAWNLLESATSWTKGLGAWIQRLPLTWALTLPDLLLVGSGRGPGQVLGVLRLLSVPRHGILFVRLIAVTRIIPTQLDLQIQILHIKEGQVQESNQEAQAN